MRYVLNYEGYDSEPFEAPSDEAAERMAASMVGDWFDWGDPGQLAKTEWVHEMLVRLDDRTVVADMWRRIDPPGAEVCPDGQAHEWVDTPTLYRLVGGLRENPGVWGHGGGVIVTEVCRRCGTEVRRDTWCDCDGSGPHECSYVTVGKYARELVHA